jgi:hypothetical protein
VVLAFITVMVEGPAVEVNAVLLFEAMVPVGIIDAVMIVSMPCRIGIVRVSGIVSFKVYLDPDLGACRLDCQRASDDHGECKQLRVHNITF